MSASPALIAETRSDEGYKAKPYRDSRGLWTFGNGRCLETHPLTGAEWKMLLDRGYLETAISAAGADLLESLGLASVEAALAHDYADFWSRLNGARQDALTEMAYQMGVAKEEAFHDMVRHIRLAVQTGAESEWGLAEQAGLDSDWARQTPQRAGRVMRQLGSGEYPS